MSGRNALIGALLVIVAVAALIVLSSGEDDGEPITDRGNAIENSNSGEKSGAGGKRKAPITNPDVPTIVVGEDGTPIGGIAELSYERDERVRFKVESAVADEIHVHGYDLMKDVEAGGAVSFDFPASLEGIFEAELEERGEQILELRVGP